jgi:hypothetical protein
MRARTVATLLAIAGLALASPAGAATPKYHPCRKTKPGHTNCGKHKHKGHGRIK